MPTTTPILSVKNLRKSYPGAAQPVTVLNGIDLELASGSFESIMGASGSGKTTLLHLLAGLLTPDAGSVTIEGQEITTLADETATKFRRRRIGLIFQEFNLIPTLTAAENVALPLLLDRRQPEQKRLDELLERLGLSQRRHHLPSQLSGGERQRVAIARALVNDPALVLADEPTGNLDSPAGRDFCSLLREMNQTSGCTILLVSHDPIVAAAATRTHLMRDGRLAECFETHNDSALLSQRYLASMAAH